MYRFQHGRSSAIWINRPIYPGVAMVAADHPFLGKFGAAHRADHIPDGFVRSSHFEMHLDSHWPRSPAIVSAISDDDNLAAHVDLHGLKLLVVLRTSIVGIHDVGFRVAGGRVGVEGGQYAGVVLVGILLDMLAAGPMHFYVGRSRDLDAYLLRKREQHLVFDDLCVESSLAKFLRHIFGG